jgi:hypothetical protein
MVSRVTIPQDVACSSPNNFANTMAIAHPMAIFIPFIIVLLSINIIPPSLIFYIITSLKKCTMYLFKRYSGQKMFPPLFKSGSGSRG